MNKINKGAKNMAFCKQCGTKQETLSENCHHCGAKLPHPPAEKQPVKKGPTKKQKIIIAGLLASVIAGVGLYQTGSTMADGTKKVDNIRIAMSEKDSESLLSYMTTRDSEKELTERHAEDIISLYHDDRYFAEELDDYLANRSEWIQRGANPALAEEQDIYDLPWFSFEKTGRQWLLYDNYDIVIDTIPLYVYSNESDVSFSVDGQKVDHKDGGDGSFQLGNYLPGHYAITGQLESDFVDLEVETEKAHFYDHSVDVWFDVNHVELTSSIDDATLFINDEDSGITVGTAPTSVGPVLLDGSMTFHVEKEAPFGMIASESYPVYDSYMDLSLSATDEVLTNAVADIQDSFETDGMSRIALNSYDTELLEKIDFNKDNTSIYFNESAWELHVPVTEYWQVDTSWSSDDIDMNAYENHRQYEMVYNTASDTWVLQQTPSIYNSYDGAVETISFDYEGELGDILAQQEANTLEEFRESAETNLNQLFHNFINANIEMINYGHSTEVLSYIDPEATDYREIVTDYAEYLEDRNITQTFMDVEVLDFSTSDDESYHVTTFEDYIIYYDDDDDVKRKTFETEYNVRLTSEGFKVVELLETNEQSSEDW